MQLELIHRHGSYCEAVWGGATLFRYTYRPDVAPVEGPKPYFHPLRTLRGNVVTAFRPHDHRWHHGLAMTLTDVSGENFWGGPTYVPEQGYVQLDNVGRQVHAAWRRVEAAGEAEGGDSPQPEAGAEQNRSGVALVEALEWLGAGGEHLLNEERAIRVVAVNPGKGYWTLEFTTQLVNVAGEALEIGSPTTRGRPNAGYGGLFWRGPRSFRGGKVIGPGGRDGEEANMGASGPWLAFVGRHDEVDDASTLIFVDSPHNPRYPAKWFVRSEPYACVSFAFMFDEIYKLGPGERLSLAHRIVIADGAWDRETIETVASREQAGFESR